MMGLRAVGARDLDLGMPSLGQGADVGRDIDKFAAAIQREIYDKVDLSKL